MGGFRMARLVRLAPASSALGAVSTVVAGAASLLVPTVAGSILNEVLGHRRISATLGLLAALLAAGALAQLAGDLAEIWATTRINVSLRRSLLRRVFALGIPGTRRYSDGDLVTRLTANSITAAEGVPMVVQVVVAIATSAGGLLALWLIDWWLAVVFLACMLPAVLLLRRLMGQVTSAYNDYLQHLSAIAGRLTDALLGSRTIRASGTLRQESARVLAPLPDLARAGMSAWDIQRAASWKVGLVVTASRVLVLVVGGISLAEHRISAGGFLASSLYLSLALGLVFQADTVLRIGHARANAARVSEVLDDEPPRWADGPERPDRRPTGPGALSFRGVSFRTGDRPILDGVDLDLPAGASIALVGRSCAGKTTLALLAGGLLRPDEGSVLLDGIPLHAFDPEEVHAAVSYAFDRPVLLGGTLRQALTYGRPGISEQAVEDAARLAQAHDFISRLPEGFDTPLAGTAFSGGELQRLGIARAVAHGGRVFVLDDATSSLDTVTEARVTQALTEGLGGRTRLVVAHRATTAARADLVAWLDEGRIRVVAPHAALWRADPVYRAVFASEEPCAEEVA
jgi:ATP-binding cassette subfamily B protein